MENKKRVFDGEYTERLIGGKQAMSASEFENHIAREGRGYAKSGKVGYPEKFTGRGASESDRKWLDVVKRVGGVKGQACSGLAEYLLKKGFVDSILTGAKLSDELLDGLDDAALESVVVLISDGWSGSVGELLRCARSL